MEYNIFSKVASLDILEWLTFFISFLFLQHRHLAQRVDGLALVVSSNVTVEVATQPTVIKSQASVPMDVILTGLDLPVNTVIL